MSNGDYPPGRVSYWQLSIEMAPADNNSLDARVTVTGFRHRSELQVTPALRPAPSLWPGVRRHRAGRETGSRSAPVPQTGRYPYPLVFGEFDRAHQKLQPAVPGEQHARQ